MIYGAWSRANAWQRCIVVAFALADAGIGFLLLAAYTGRGPHTNAQQWAAGWFGLWAVLTSVLFGACVGLLAASR